MILCISAVSLCTLLIERLRAIKFNFFFVHVADLKSKTTLRLRSIISFHKFEVLDNVSIVVKNSVPSNVSIG